MNVALVRCIPRLALLAVGAFLAASLAFAQPTANSGPEYLLGSGDVLHITVYQNSDLTLDTRVVETGLISFPLLGNIRVGGLGVTATEKLIADGLRNGNFVKDPQVTVIVQQIRGNQVSVLGQVNRPGRYPIEVAGMRVTDMLATAGGAAVTGADSVVLVGTRDGKPFRAVMDLPGLFAAGGSEKDIPVQNGDTLWVDRQPLVYIYGEVQRPGPMRVERGMTVIQVLAGGGGLTLRGTQKGIRLHRKNGDGKVVETPVLLDDQVQDGDVVYVRESLF